jgi:Protein of unknown function (DUF2971)
MPGEQKLANIQVVAAALNRIYRFNLDREHRASNRQPQNGILFHYTTADGLKGIIERNEVWATSAYYLNDSAEITYGYGVLNNVLNDWISNRALPEDSLSLGLARQLQSGFDDDLLNRNLIYPIYLACFCDDDNLLSQWRAYGQPGGYCLGFRVPSEGPVFGLRPARTVLYTARWLKIDYDRNEQSRRCRTILEYLLPMLDEPEPTSAIREIDPLSPQGYQGIYSAISEILLEEIVGFKNKAFEVEKEWRIVIRRRELLKQGTDDGGHTPVPVHFRSRGLLTSYVKLIPSYNENVPARMRPDLLPIASVRSGPTLHLPRTDNGSASRQLTHVPPCKHECKTPD